MTLLLPLLLSLASPAFAGDPAPAAAAPAAQTVTIKVLVVHATDSQSGTDPQLKALAPSFQHLKYNGYKLLSSDSKPIEVGGSAAFPIEGGRKVKVSLLSVDDTRAKVRVEITNKDGKLLDTTVSINRDGTFIVAGPKYEDGILVLPLQASY